MTVSTTVDKIARLGDGEVRGDGSVVMVGIADVVEAESDQLAFVSRAGAVLVPQGFGATPMASIVCERVDRAVAQVLGLFSNQPAGAGTGMAAEAVPDFRLPDVALRDFAPRMTRGGVHPTVMVDNTAQVGEACQIGPNVVIGVRARLGARCVIHAGAFVGRNVSIGDDCLLGPNAVVADGCELGDRVALHAGAVIGGAGFGFYFDQGKHHRVPHIGTVVIEDDVEIGSCSCIDRAKFGVTRIGRGTKIDNLVQVAHNVHLGEDCVVAGLCGIGGSVRIGDHCVLGGRVSVVDGVRLADRVMVGAGTLITKDVPAGTTVLGNPAQDIRAEQRVRAARRRLPKLVEQVRRLVNRVKNLEQSTNDQPRGRA